MVIPRVVCGYVTIRWGPLRTFSRFTRVSSPRMTTAMTGIFIHMRSQQVKHSPVDQSNH